MKDLQGKNIQVGDTVVYGKSDRWNPIAIGEVMLVVETGCEILGKGKSKTGFITNGDRIVILRRKRNNSCK